MDYGKMAATFVNARTGKAVRVAVRADNNEKLKLIAKKYRRKMNGAEAILEALSALPEKHLLGIQKVKVTLKPEDLPGAPLHTVICGACGERVMDMREVCHDGRFLCKPCAAGKAYYKANG